MEMKMIDVSKHNGTIDWEKVKAAGIEGVIIRAGYGRFISQKDACFEKNYSGAKAVGLHVGAYWYSYAADEATAKQEAETFLEVIKGKSFELPVYLDIEDKTQTKLSKKTCTAMATVFCETLEAAGCFCGVYSFDSFFATYLDETIPKRFSIWAARVENIKPTYAKTYDIWQHSWKGSIDGIKGDVDLNICYKDFPSIITKNSLNGCKPDEPEKEAVQEPEEKPEKEPEKEAETDKQETAQDETAVVKFNISAYKLNLTKDAADELTRTLNMIGMTVQKKETE
jgi:GH25 family lysozyme M1 (1,4-beta-N-acetylmuramidase)